MRFKTIHIIYSGLGGHFDYVFNLVQEQGSQASTEILFFGVEPVPEYYLRQCDTAHIQHSFIHKKGTGFKEACRILRWLRKQKPALIYVHSNAAVFPVRIYKILSRTKAVLVEHHNNALKTHKDWKRSTTAHKYFDSVIYLTAENKRLAREHLKSLFSNEKSLVIETGLPATCFNQKVSFNQDKLVIGMQSRLVPIKDHPTLLDAFSRVHKKHPHCSLKIAGDGTEMQKLKDLAASLQIDSCTDFEGMLPKDRLLEWLRKLDIYVHATLGETSSIALMEALAQGLPVIASNVSGINDFLNSDTAMLVEPKNAGALSEAIENLVLNVSERQRLSQNAFTFALQNCSLKNMILKYNELEKKLISHK